VPQAQLFYKFAEQPLIQLPAAASEDWQKL